MLRSHGLLNLVNFYDMTSEIFLKNTNWIPATTLPPPKQVREANFYNFGAMLMKFCMEDIFGEIHLKRNTRYLVHVYPTSHIKLCQFWSDLDET